MLEKSVQITTIFVNCAILGGIIYRGYQWYNDFKFNQPMLLVWRPSFARIFITALDSYSNFVKPHMNGGTHTLNKEHEDFMLIKKHIAEAIRKINDEGELVEIVLNDYNWARLHQLLAVFWGTQRQILQEKERKTNIKAALEGDRAQNEAIRQMILIFEKSLVPRGLIEIDTVYVGEPEKKEPANQSFSVGTLINMNSQMVGFMSGGTMNQDNSIENTFNALSKGIGLLDIPEDTKKEALADVMAMNAQVIGGKPDKGIMTSIYKKLKSVISSALVHGAATSDIYKNVVEPNLGKIGDFIAGLK